jgi:hypothetical protein
LLDNALISASINSSKAAQFFLETMANFEHISEQTPPPAEGSSWTEQVVRELEKGFASLADSRGNSAFGPNRLQDKAPEVVSKNAKGQDCFDFAAIPYPYPAGKADAYSDTAKEAADLKLNKQLATA